MNFDLDLTKVNSDIGHRRCDKNYCNQALRSRNFLRFLTVELLYCDGIVVGKGELTLISSMPWVHQRPRNAGMSEPDSVAYLVGGHQEQISAWKYKQKKNQIKPTVQ